MIKNHYLTDLIKGRGGELPEYQLNTTLAKHSWLRRGGNVKYWWLPKNREELVNIGRFLYENNQPFITIGHTSNIYFKDSFSIDHIIDTRKLTSYEILNDNLIICDCGVHMSKLAKYAILNGIEGYEGFINLPGTVGGAIVNNSGCYRCGIDKVLKSIELLTPEGKIVNLDAHHLEYKFRSSDLKTGKLKGIVIRAFLDISNKGSSERLKRIAEINAQNRKETQDPPAYNLGSTIIYSGYKSNLRNIILRSILKIYRLVDKSTSNTYKISKFLILSLYNKHHLSKYISDKRISCYIWKDKEADIYFDEYLDLMRSVFKQFSIEIEVYS